MWHKISSVNWLAQKNFHEVIKRQLIDSESEWEKKIYFDNFVSRLHWFYQEDYEINAERVQ